MKTNSQEQDLIIIKLKSFQDEAAAKYNNTSSQNLINWFVKYALQTHLQSIPRVNQFEVIDNILKKDKENIEKLFKDEKVACGLLENAKEIYDLAFINEYFELYNSTPNRESKAIINTIEKQFGEFMDRAQDIDSILFIQNLNLFISMKQAYPKQNSALLSNPVFIRQRAQIAKCYQFVLKPLFQKKSLKKYYTKLHGLVSWLVVMGESRLDLAYDLAKKINSFVIYNKSENCPEMVNVCNAVFDLLSIKFPRESNLKHQNLASLIFRLQSPNIRIGRLFEIWLDNRYNFLDTLDFQNFFRVLTNLGASNIVLQLLIKIWNAILKAKKYNIALHIFSGYIRKEFTKLEMQTADQFIQYFKIIKHYMIGLSNRERFEGQEIDELTNNICDHALKRNISINNCYKHIIEIYSVYENRFSCLSQSSKRFFNEIKSLAKIKLQTADIHALYELYFIQDMGLEEYQSEWQSLRKTSNRYRGLQNLGNTCYINSFMQALYMTKKFRMLIHNFTQDGALPSNKAKIYALQYLFEQLTRKQFEAIEPLKPDYFRIELPEPFRSSFTQQDSAEFGRVYLEELSKELEGGYIEKLQKLLVQKLTKIIRCLKCKTEKKQQESVFDLILTLEQGQSQICLSRLIQKYFTPETFTNQNKIDCNTCKSRTQAISQLIPQKFSDILVLTLSIFQYVGEGKKILLPFQFEFTLNLGILLNNPEMGDYELYAFIVHMGSLQGSGHYVCYARNLEQNPMIWYNLNDGYVEELEIGKPQDFGFSENETPYMLFYSKKSLSVSRIVKA